ESAIRDTFNSDHLDARSTRFALDETLDPDTDIELFLFDKFEVLRSQHRLRRFIPNHWPAHDQIQSLVKKSSGQFIYASTVMKYLQCPRQLPQERLDIILGLRPSGRDNPFADLDALYTHILSSADNISHLLSIIRILLFMDTKTEASRWSIPELVPSPSSAFIENLLMLGLGEVTGILDDFHSIIDIPESGHVPLRIHHASLRDFLLNKQQSKELTLDDSETCHAHLAACCLKHISYFANDSSALNSSVAYSLTTLGHHLELARPTTELVESIEHCD